MTRRSGVTLVEVLVAIFVMGIGLMALLTLFPIGVLTMRQAIQDDRTAHAAASATAIAKMKISPSNFENWFKNADHGPPAPAQPGGFADAQADGPSHSLFLDQVGFLNFGLTADWVGGSPLGGIRRLGMPDPDKNDPLNVNQPLLWQISPDDIAFDPVGIPVYSADPVPPNPGVFQRNSTYSWAYLLRRPTHGKANVVELTVVVYNERPLALNSQLQAGESLYPATFNPAANTVTVTWGPEGPPPVRVGGWILDTTPVMVQPGPPPVYGPSHARFYRVVSIVQTTNTSADLEVQSSITGFPLPAPNPPNTVTGTIVVIEGIAEVFEKGPVLWQNP